MYEQDLTLNNLQYWYAIKSNKTKSYIFNIDVWRGFDIK